MRGMDDCQCHFCKQLIKMYTHHHKVKNHLHSYTFLFSNKIDLRFWVD
jgi:hypothetical protein